MVAYDSCEVLNSIRAAQGFTVDSSGYHYVHSLFSESYTNRCYVPGNGVPYTWNIPPVFFGGHYNSRVRRRIDRCLSGVYIEFECTPNPDYPLVALDKPCDLALTRLQIWVRPLVDLGQTAMVRGILDASIKELAQTDDEASEISQLRFEPNHSLGVFTEDGTWGMIDIKEINVEGVMQVEFTGICRSKLRVGDVLQTGWISDKAFCERTFEVVETESRVQAPTVGGAADI